MSNYFLATFMLALMTSLNRFSSAHIIYKTRNLICAANPEFVENVSCELKPINWDKTIGNLDGDIVSKLSNVTMHVKTFTKNYANQFQPGIFDATVNLCDLLNKKRFNAVASIFINILKTVSNINHSCPYTGRLTAKGLYFNEKMLPFVSKIGTYRGVFSFYEGYPMRNAGTIIFEIEAKESQMARSDRRWKIKKPFY